MEAKSFADYLIQKHEVTAEEIQACVYAGLLQKGYLSEARLKQHLEEFTETTELRFFSESKPATLPPIIPIDHQTNIEQQGVIRTESIFPPSSLSNKTEANLDISTEWMTEQEKKSIPDLRQEALLTEPSSLPITKKIIPNPERKKILEKLTEERYEVIETLGEGGMGIVQKVYDRFLGREVALKRIRFGELNDPDLSEMQQLMLWRLNREASITAYLEHPNIVPLYEIQTKKDTELCFTMRKIEGETFRDILKKYRLGKLPFDESRVLSIFLKVCDAVAYAHSRKIIHRDLKPENIMVGQFGEVYVMDWGLAKRVDEVEEKVTPILFQTEENFHTIGGMGTPGYMPPEQREDASKVRLQADIYALGKILKECFTLISPYEEFKKRVDSEERRRKLSIKEDRKPGDTGEERRIPLDIQAIVQKSTEIEPKKRYQKIQTLVADLEHYLKHGRVSVREYTFLELFEKWLKRNQQKITIFLAVFISVLGVVFFLRWNAQWEKEKQFNRIYSQAEEFCQSALNVNFPHKQERSDKLQLLINALNRLNFALSIYPKNEKAEIRKKDIGKILLKWCIESQDYQLAHYVAGDFQGLSILSEIEKQAWKDYVEEEQNKTLKQHKQRLQFWLQELKKPTLEKGMRENAIFEISKMPETEIFENIISLVEEGTNYFLHENESVRNARQDEFYVVMATILGRLENPFAKETFLKCLTQMEQVLSPLPSAQRKIADVQYMIQLAQGLAFAKAEGASKALREIRQKMGQNGLFWYGTNLTYKTLLQQDNIEQTTLATASEFHERGLAKYAQGDLKGAIEDFTQAIVLNPYKSESYVSRGLVKIDQKEHESAIEDFNYAIRIYPENDAAYHNRALVRYEMKDYKTALEDGNQAILLNPKSPFSYTNRGLVRKELGDLQGALEDYGQALLLNPQDAHTYVNRGFVKQMQEDWNGAMEDYNYAIHLNANFTEAYANRASVWSKKGNIEKSLEDYEQALHLNPQDFKAYYNRGCVKEEQKDLTGAIQDYTQAITLNGQFLTAFKARATAKKLKGDEEGALQDYQQAITLAPQDALLYSQRALLKGERSDLEGSLQDHQKAIDLAPENAEVYYNRGITRNNHKDFQGALQDFHKAIQLKADLILAYNECGLIYQQQEQFEQAILVYNQAIQYSPNFLFAYNNRGLAKSALNRHQEAIEDFNQVLRLDAKFVQAYNNRGLAQKELHNLTEALQDYNLAIQTDPTSPFAYCNRGHLLQEQGQFAKAIIDYQKALQLNPKMAEAYYGRGSTHERQGQIQEAIQDYGQFIQLRPFNLLGYNHRGPLYYQQKEYLKAIEDFSKSIEINPNQANIFANRGLARAISEDLLNGLSDYNEAIRLNPELQNSWNTRGMIKKKLQDWKGALADFTEALQREPKNSEILNNRGMMYQALNAHEKAFADFQKALQYNPKFAYAWYNLAVSCQSLKHPDKAIFAYEKGMQIYPVENMKTAIATLYFERFQKYFAEKKWELAQKDGERFLFYASTDHEHRVEMEQKLQQLKTAPENTIETLPKKD